MLNQSLKTALSMSVMLGLLVTAANRPLSGQISNIVLTSAASFERGRPARGALATIFCTGLPSMEGTTIATSFPLPKELAGVAVTIGGVAAPILAVAHGNGFQQINLQIPQEDPIEATPEGVPVVVRGGGITGTALSLFLSHSPGEFFRLPRDLGGLSNSSGLFQHASDYSLVTRENPARPGETIIGYLTGIPVRTVPEVPTGEAAPLSPPALVPRLLEPITSPGLQAYFTIRFGDTPGAREVVPSFLGLTPGLAGVYQANFTIPFSIPSGFTGLFFVRHRWIGLPSSSPETILSTQVVIPISPPLP